MKKLFFLSFIALLLSGCTTTMTVSSLTTNNRANLVRLSRNMNKTDALRIMGTNIGPYTCDLSTSKSPLTVTLNNPYRTEMVQTSGRMLEIVYYITELKNNNCIVDNNELTPLVFEDSKLIGWGNNFLLEVVPEIKQNQQPSQGSR